MDFEVIPYWQRLGTIHGRLENGQEGPLFAQTTFSLNLPRYRTVLVAYREKYHLAIDAIECAVSEREHIARRSSVREV